MLLLDVVKLSVGSRQRFLLDLGAWGVAKIHTAEYVNALNVCENVYAWWKRAIGN